MACRVSHQQRFGQDKRLPQKPNNVCGKNTYCHHISDILLTFLIESVPCHYLHLSWTPFSPLPKRQYHILPCKRTSKLHLGHIVDFSQTTRKSVEIENYDALSGLDVDCKSSPMAVYTKHTEPSDGRLSRTTIY